MSPQSSDEKLTADTTLIQILEGLLERNEDITARAVARLHPAIRHASTITRSPARTALVGQFQSKQQEIRKHLGRQTKRSKESIAAELATKDQRIAELERQVDILRTSHVAMIRAVGEMGGMSRWLKFYEGFKETRDQLVNSPRDR